VVPTVKDVLRESFRPAQQAKPILPVAPGSGTSAFPPLKRRATTRRPASAGLDYGCGCAFITDNTGLRKQVIWVVYNPAFYRTFSLGWFYRSTNLIGHIIDLGLQNLRVIRRWYKILSIDNSFFSMRY
jgi:hypothetical protein